MLIESSEMNARIRIIVALDVSDIADAAQLVEHLEPYVGGFKVGLEFITGSYTQLIARLSEQEAAQRLAELRRLYGRIAHSLMWDGKFSDIPNTIGGATRALQPLTPKFFTVHASAGRAAIAAAVANRGGSAVLGVTVLTSIDPQECRSVFGDEPGAKVLEFAQLLLAAGADGIVCAPWELPVLAQHQEFRSLVKVIPGIRPADAEAGDQSRVGTPGWAIKQGADHLVIGRAITKPDRGTPVEAALRIIAEIEAA
jgi:orotidine-5'-phosphate decarboxylase